MKISTLALALAAALPSLASAGEVVLRNGSTFVGSVREEGDRIIVEMDYGTLSFKKIDVKTISIGEDMVRIFDQRAAKANGSKELVDVALWGREKGLGRRSEDLLLRIIQVDPDQAEARKALGHENVGGRWLYGDALLAARGLVKVDGRIVPVEVVERQLDRKMAAQQERDRIELDSRVAAQRHEQEMLKLGLERERIELERRLGEQRAIEAQWALNEQHWALRTGQYQYYNNVPYNNAWNQVPQPCPPQPVAAPAPARKPPPTPSPRDFSPLPPTPPTVLPITPPYRQPPSKQPPPPPTKADEEKDKEKRR